MAQDWFPVFLVMKYAVMEGIDPKQMNGKCMYTQLKWVTTARC